MPRASRRPDRAVVTGCFLLCGVVTVLLGPVIPELRLRWGVSAAAAATLFPAQYVASALGAIASGFHLRRALVAGYALIAAGAAGLAAGGWPLAHVSMATAGLGLGLVIAGSNLWTAHRDPERRASTLAILNFTWGLGAVACPLLFTAVRGLVPLAAALGLIALLAALASVATAWSLAQGEPLPAVAPTATGSAGGGADGLFLLAMGATFLLYVGSESAVAGWLITLADERAGQRGVGSLLIHSGFWGAVLAGRAAAPLALRRMRESTLYTACLAVAATGTATLLASGATAALAAGAVVAGLGMAPIYPLAVARLAAATASTRSRTSGWVLACGGLGGALLPWLAGEVGSAAGGAGPGFLVPLAGLLLLAALHAVQLPRATRGPLP